MQTGQRLLLIESDPLLADVTSYRLELLGYRVVVTKKVAETWTAIERATPHAILLNLDVTTADGFGLLEQFASDPKTAEIPVLVMSAGADLDRVEKAWKDGARDYLLTPYDPLTLERKVERLLDSVELQSKTAADGPSVLNDEYAAADDDEYAADADDETFDGDDELVGMTADGSADDDDSPPEHNWHI